MSRFVEYRRRKKLAIAEHLGEKENEDPNFKIDLTGKRYCPIHPFEKNCRHMMVHKHEMRMMRMKNRRQINQKMKLRSGKTLAADVRKRSSEDRKLSDQFFNFVDQLLGPFTIDVFGGHELHQKKIQTYFYDPAEGPCLNTKGKPDGYSIDWGVRKGISLYMNPPYSQKDIVLEKLKADRARAVLIAPHCWEESLNGNICFKVSLLFQVLEIPSHPSQAQLSAQLYSSWTTPANGTLYGKFLLFVVTCGVV